MKPFTLSRRTFLRAAGVSIGLPMLEAMQPRSAFGQSAAPRRLLFFYVPCGIHMAEWTPDREGAGYDLKRILAPLASLQDDVSVLTGLENRNARPDGAGDHASGTGAFLTCAHPFKTSGAGIRNGISVDQVAANALGAETRFASLQYGSDGGGSTGDCDSGYSCAYARNISWASETQPLPKETSPSAAFDRLFGGVDPRATAELQARRRRYEQSILDFVREDARRLQAKLGRTDRRKMDEYLTSIRELEVRLQMQDGAPVCVADRPENGGDIRDRVRKMMDVMVTALRCDATRFVTFMLGNAGHNRSFPFLGFTEQHHDLSHHQGDPAKHEKLTQIGTWEVEQLAWLLTEMKSISEGEGNMLDNSLVFFSSEISDGNRHNHDDLPVLLAGKGGGAVRPGRHVRLPDRTPIANLFLSMLQVAGVDAAGFGDSTGSLSELA